MHYTAAVHCITLVDMRLWWGCNSNPSPRTHSEIWSTLVQVMACCLKAPSHYLNQCWLIINGFLWHAHKTNFIEAQWCYKVSWMFFISIPAAQWSCRGSILVLLHPSVLHAMSPLWLVAYFMDCIHIWHKYNPWEDNVSHTTSRSIGQRSKSHRSFEFLQSRWGVSW